MKTLKFIQLPVALLLAAMVMITSSCSEDFLETEPSTAIPTEDVFKSIVTAEAALIGAYDAMSAWGVDGLYFPLMSDVMGEDVMINNVNNYNWFVPVYQLEVLPNYQYPGNIWRGAYKVIFDANNIIENASKIPDASNEEIQKIQGQARTMRAYMMLKLAQFFAPAYTANPAALSIMNVNTVIDVNDEPFGRATNEEVYVQIVNDLLSAIESLDVSSDKGFFDKKAAQAILARAYLNMGEYAKASEMAVAAQEGIELMSLEEMFWGFNYRTSETIFTIAYTPDDNNIYLSIPSFYWPVAGYSSIRANDEFVNQFELGDVRAQFFLKEPSIDADRHLVLKFQHWQSIGNAERVDIRASEMVLIEAECEARLGNYSIAQDALLKIQERSVANAQKSTATGEALVNEILLERRKELFGEGFRLNDIKRTQSPLVRTGDHWSKYNFSANDPDYYRLTFPIPQSEIDANENISQADQNAGY